ncbi:MAG: hypothetical protein A3E31_07500 [Candidatus Rokubacteria bacterium RIFCSPHIGHO2_12_FULL_73_22]|nr:MAG: hypothetical protein A3E31_07500 [Candidatus Rokubacteria bacterium RIFCSPHIGHO2_12_FULL_73_22]
MRLVPTLSVLAEASPAFRFEVSARAAGGWTPWVGAATVGDAGFAPLPAAAGALAAEIDELVAAPPADAVRLRLRLPVAGAAALARAPWLVALSAWDGAPEASDAATSPRVRLAVPPRSQMEEDPAIRMRICSPTSVAMVLEHHGRRVATAALAAEVFHAGLDRYGVWPAAIRAAGRHGVAGYVLRFPGWAAAAWCLAQGLPVIASVRYAAGELGGAALAETSGHLLVLTGVDGERVLVNDPAAPSAASVARSYARAELGRAWLARGGVGYVLFRPTTSPSARSPRP